MPSLHGAGIRVCLASQTLNESLTDKIHLKKGYTAAHQSEEAEKSLRESVHTLLHEERVQFPEQEGAFGLNWLGGTPFLQVVVAGPLSDRSEKLAGLRDRLSLVNGHVAPGDDRRSSLGRSTRSGRMLSSGSAESEESTPFEEAHSSGMKTEVPRYDSSKVKSALIQLVTWSNPVFQNLDLEPQALILHVMLTDKTFFYDPYDNSPQHLKIDVLFNGQLSNCVLMHTDYIRSGAKSLHQIFAGTRVDYMAERPWVMHESGQTTGIGSAAAKSTSAQDRWTEICKALMTEANERGVDGDGERPPTAAYLRELASMRIPDSVKDMQKPGGRTFGVIDVIVTVGVGKKIVNGVTYLKAPTRLPDGQYDYQVKEGSEFDMIQSSFYAAGLAADASTNQRELPEKEEDVEGGTDPQLFESKVPALAALSSAQPPILSLPPTFQNPFAKGRISSVAMLDSSAPSTNQPLSNSYDSFFGAHSYRERGIMSESSYSRYIDPNIQNDNHVEENQQSRNQGQPTGAFAWAFQETVQPFQAIRSAHTPTVPLARSYTPSGFVDRRSREAHNSRMPFAPQSGYNVNQYDSFEHANPYQLPYTGMIKGLGLSTLDGPASSPLRDAIGGQLTLPRSMPTPEELIQITAPNSSVSSSPYTRPMIATPHHFRTSFAPINAPHNSAPFPAAPPSGLGIIGPSEILNTRCFFSGSPLLHSSTDALPPGQYGAGPYMQPLKRPSDGPPPPLGMFKVTEKPKMDLYTGSYLSDSRQLDCGVVVRRLIIYGRNRIRIVDHLWKTPRRLPSKTVFTLYKDTNVKGSKGYPGTAKYVESSHGSRRQTLVVPMLETPPSTSPSVPIDLDQGTGTVEIKRDSIHDGLISISSTKSTGSTSHMASKMLADIPTVERMSVLAEVPSHISSTAPRQQTVSSRNLGEQGPKANTFVIDNPEELLRKGSKVQSRSGFTSPTKVNTPAIDAEGQSTEVSGIREADEPIGYKELNSRSSSPLSELPYSPQLSPTAQATTTDIDQQAKIEKSSLPAPAISAAAVKPTLPLPLSSSARLSTTIAEAVNHNQQRGRVPTSSPLKRKRETSAITQRRIYIKPLRSPDRLNATDNPPLNKDCVIHYAVSEKEGGALRQVKSERQGVFSEGSVVVGMRFFVPG
ncbi:hypothetical protein N0V90_009123 [Kalmusia sp. IMI 367209]|nr:hypothetical protein N0V90_009123 [Kalmusia sp. IMI 367209]